MESISRSMPLRDGSSNVPCTITLRIEEIADGAADELGIYTPSTTLRTSASAAERTPRFRGDAL
jgi:hypothetical protein